MSQAEERRKLRDEAHTRSINFATDYTAWLENRVIEARSLAKTCYDHSVFPADSSEVAIDAQAKFEKWGMR